MAKAPKVYKSETQKIINAWETLAPDVVFAGMTLAQFKAKVQPSFDERETISTLRNDLLAALDRRDDADKVTSAACQKVIHSVKGHPDFGDDSGLYDAMGYVRKSARASGLTIKSKSEPQAAA